MGRNIEKLPAMIKFSAVLFGFPLVLLGFTLMMTDIAQMIRLHSLASAPFSGLAVGPAFVLLGASFLWPILHHGPHH